MDELTVQDIDVLIEAVEAWITAESRSKLLAGLIVGAMAGNGDSERSFDVFHKITEGREDGEASRKETAIMLKAKLLKLRDRLMIAEVATNLP